MATTLLLADDSATIAKILGMALASEDYEIKSVLTAEDAVHELKKNPPFFFLVDLTLPGKSGFEFAEMIRADSKLAKIKVVLLSSAFEPVDAAAVKACGADLVIAKPFDPAELRASLRSIKDAPPKFASGSKVSGSLSGYTVKASEGTRTSLTDTDLVNARAVIGGNAPTEAPAAEELLLGMQGDQDANSILAGLAENAGGDSGLLLGDVPAQNSENDLNNATAMLDLSGHMALGQVPEPILDLSNSFGTPAAGTMLTAMVDMSKVDLGKEAKALESPPPPPRAAPVAPPAAPHSAPPYSPKAAKPALPPSVPPPTTPSAPRAHPSSGLSPNAEALAAFFSAEIDNKKPSTPPPAPPTASIAPVESVEEFEKSLASIEWNDRAANADLDSWTSSSQAAPAAAQFQPTKSMPKPAAPAPQPSLGANEWPTQAPAAAAPEATPARNSSPAPRPSHASASPRLNGEPASFVFDTGGSNFRFAEDYITRITKSFVGNPIEEVPKDFSGELPVFPQQSHDAPRNTGGGGAGNWSPVDSQKMEQIIREEVQMAVREVVEKVAWEIIPELAENLIKKELEKVMKQLEG